jgi:hypothetical protein
MFLREENHRPLANHNDFVRGRFLAEKTLLVGYWNLRMLRKNEVRNRGGGDNFNTQFLVEPHRGGPDESHPE